MKILNGWKEIAEHLHRTPRSVQRWERLGLPVRRLSASPRSPIVAFSNELEDWIRRKKKTQTAVTDPAEAHVAYMRTLHETQRLVDELKAARLEHKRLVATIRGQIRG
jgi:phage terminase Nu1 subunit (DNA packaging protein)